jgi:acyl-CoA thioester hydrolase
VRHEHRVQLRWSDPDSYGHVNHARALSLFEDARLALAGGLPGIEPGRQPDIILARLEVDYLRQLYYRVGEQLSVRSWVAKIGTKSVTVRQELIQDGVPAIRVDGICVMFDVRTDTSRPVTDDERAYWERFRED